MKHLAETDLQVRPLALTDDPDGLSQIHDHGCHAVIWRRDPLATFAAWIARQPVSTLPQTRLILRKEFLRDALHNVVRRRAASECAKWAMLAEDCAALATMLADIAKTPLVRLRLAPLGAAQIAPLDLAHQTQPLRLICTYGAANWRLNEARGAAAADLDYRVPACSPLVLGASLGPLARQRVYPPHGSGQTSLCLCVDPVFDTSDQNASQTLH